MSEPLRLLLLEDSPSDSELNERALRKGGIEFTALRVDTLAAFTAALDEFEPDLILADYHLPGFDGLQALAIAREKRPHLPFLFVSGAMGEELAVEAVKQGASDYIVKDRLARLPIAVRRALEEKASRARRQAAESEIRRVNRILRTISACNEDLVRAHCETDLLAAICRDLVEVGAYPLAWVSYPAAAQGPAIDAAPVTVFHYGDEAAFQVHAALAQDPEHARLCLTRIALRDRRTALCSGLLASDECGFGRLHDAGVRAILALPLLAGERLLGAVTIFAANAEAFDAAEIDLMEELAADLAYGINALRTSEERDHYLSQYSQAMRNTVAAIARTLEMRDPYTAGHQQRVTALALATARALGLDEGVSEGLYFGGMIHDIGKIAVPAEILSKPGKISKAEFQLIQGHPETGYEIVKDIDFPWPVADMILQHHERLDGSGYPHGLKGDEIRLEARILAVADVVEAMSSHRPYRPSLGMEAALAEIERGSGVHFDAAVVAACVKVVQENGMRLPE